MYNSDFSKIQSTQAYMAGMRPVLNKRALFSDVSSEFVCPPEPNPYSIVTINSGLQKIILIKYTLSVKTKSI